MCHIVVLVTEYNFTIINDVNFFQIFMNFGWIMVGQSSGNFCYQKFLLSIKIFKVRFLSIIQEFFTEIFLGAVVFFVRFLHDGFVKLFWHKGSFISTNALLFYRDMVLKYIVKSAFTHTKIIYVRSSCNYVISEFDIIEIFIIASSNYLWF